MSAGEGRGRIEELVRSARAERVRARLPRYLFLAFLAITCLLGLRSIVSPVGPASAERGSGGLVDQAAEDFALRFTRAYLTYDAARPDLRQRQLAEFLPPELDPDGGLIPSDRGTQSVGWLHVAQHQEALAGGVVIVVAAQLKGDPAPTYLAVPVDRRPSGGLQLTAYPSLVGPPIVSIGSIPEREEVTNEAIGSAAERVVTNYLAANKQNLAADLAEGAEVSLPAEPLRVLTTDAVTWAADQDTPAVLVTVEARQPDGPLWTLTYELGIDQSSGERTTVTYIETVPNAT